MKTVALFLCLFALIFLPTVLVAQPDWEVAVPLLNVDYVTCATSDGYGQHILHPHPTAAQYKHLLLGNDGLKIASNSEQVAPPRTNLDLGASITNFGGVLSIIARNSATQLYLYQSSDGGANWTPSAIVYNLPVGSINHVDAFADARGVHIVWDNTTGTKVYYNRYNINGTWEDAFEVTDLNGTPISGFRPKVVTSANKVHVSFVRDDAGQYNVCSSRDYDFTTSSWDNLDKPTAQMGQDIVNQSMV